MNLVRIKILSNPLNMMVEVVLNQDNILDFPKVHLYCVFAIQNITFGFQCTLLFFKVVMLWRHQPIGLQIKKVNLNPRVLFQMTNTWNKWTFSKIENPILI